MADTMYYTAMRISPAPSIFRSLINVMAQKHGTLTRTCTSHSMAKQLLFSRRGNETREPFDR